MSKRKRLKETDGSESVRRVGEDNADRIMSVGQRGEQLLDLSSDFGRVMSASDSLLLRTPFSHRVSRSTVPSLPPPKPKKKKKNPLYSRTIFVHIPTVWSIMIKITPKIQYLSPKRRWWIWFNQPHWMLIDNWFFFDYALINLPSPPSIMQTNFASGQFLWPRLFKWSFYYFS